MMIVDTRGRCAGFTLVEVVVAISIAGLMLAAGAAALRSSAVQQERAKARSSDLRQILGAANLFRSVVRNAAMDTANGYRLLRQPAVDGVGVRTNTGAAAVDGGALAVRFSVRTVDAAAALVASWPDSNGGERVEILVQGARSIGFSYHLVDPSRNGWTSDIARAQGSADAVLLRIDHPALGSAMDVIARPMASGRPR